MSAPPKLTSIEYRSAIAAGESDRRNDHPHLGIAEHGTVRNTFADLRAVHDTIERASAIPEHPEPGAR